ncbi:MAG: hypothetical protein WBN66_02045 [Smithella sp.]
MKKLLLCCIFFFCITGWAQAENPLTKVGSDFTGYWSSAHLLLNGEDPYSVGHNTSLQQSVGRKDIVITYSPPWLLSFCLSLLGIMLFQNVCGCSPVMSCFYMSFFTLEHLRWKGTVTFTIIAGTGILTNPTAGTVSGSTTTAVTDASGVAWILFTRPATGSGDTVVRAQILGQANGGDAARIVYWTDDCFVNTCCGQ